MVRAFHGAGYATAPTLILQGCPEGSSCGITPLKEQIGYDAFEPGGCPVGAGEKEPSQCITGGH